MAFRRRWQRVRSPLGALVVMFLSSEQSRFGLLHAGSYLFRVQGCCSKLVVAAPLGDLLSVEVNDKALLFRV